MNLNAGCDVSLAVVVEPIVVGLAVCCVVVVVVVVVLGEGVGETGEDRTSVGGQIFTGLKPDDRGRLYPVGEGEPGLGFEVTPEVRFCDDVTAERPELPVELFLT